MMRHKVDKEYQMGEYVYLKLQPYRQTSVAVQYNIKLTTHYYGPFKIEERIGKVAYFLQLPERWRIHLVFHISLLKRSPPQGSLVTPTVPFVGDKCQLLAWLERILDRHMIRRGNQAVSQVRVKCENLGKEAASWEDYRFLKFQFLDFDPWGRESSQARGDCSICQIKGGS